jgi:hypothetical protein
MFPYTSSDLCQGRYLAVHFRFNQVRYFEYTLSIMLSLPASSSRLAPSLSTTLHQVRYTHGKQRYPKRTRMTPWTTILRDPHNPRLPLTSSGASQSHPRHLVSEPDYIPTTSSTQLDETDLTLHHTPPASAPSYTTGAKPELMKWLNGESVKLTGEEVAPLLRPAREPIGQLVKTWDGGVLDQIRSLREEGASRRTIAKR